MNKLAKFLGEFDKETISLAFETAQRGMFELDDSELAKDLYVKVMSAKSYLRILGLVDVDSVTLSKVNVLALYNSDIADIKNMTHKLRKELN